MTEEAEQAAKWKMVEELRRDREHLVVLKNQMKTLAERMIEFARAIQSPDLHAFDVGPQEITVGKWDAKPSRPIAQVTQADVNWDSLSRLVADYQKTAANVKQLQSELNLP